MEKAQVDQSVYHKNRTKCIKADHVDTVFLLFIYSTKQRYDPDGCRHQVTGIIKTGVIGQIEEKEDDEVHHELHEEHRLEEIPPAVLFAEESLSGEKNRINCGPDARKRHQS